jgi:hypothetical protein
MIPVIWGRARILSRAGEALLIVVDGKVCSVLYVVLVAVLVVVMMEG